MSVAKVWSRPLARTGIVFAALVACGLLVSACSEAPKSKAPAPQPTSSEEKASPPPVREVQEPPAPPADFKDQVGEPGLAPSSPENDKAFGSTG